MKMAPGLTVRKHRIRNRSNRSRDAASSSRTSFACIIFFLDFTSDFGAQRVIDLAVFFSRDDRPGPAAGGGVVVALEGESHGPGIAGEALLDRLPEQRLLGGQLLGVRDFAAKPTLHQADDDGLLVSAALLAALRVPGFTLLPGVRLRRLLEADVGLFGRRVVGARAFRDLGAADLGCERGGGRLWLPLRRLASRHFRSEFAALCAARGRGRATGVCGRSPTRSRVFGRASHFALPPRLRSLATSSKVLRVPSRIASRL